MPERSNLEPNWGSPPTHPPNRHSTKIIPASTPNINLKELVTVCIRPVIQAAQAQATSHTVSLCTDNQSYSQTRHRQPVIMSAQTQATSHTVSPGAGNQSYSQPRHRQPVIMSAQAQTTSHTASPGTGNLSSCQPRHKQPVIQSARAQATNHHVSPCVARFTKVRQNTRPSITFSRTCVYTHRL